MSTVSLPSLPSLPSYVGAGAADAQIPSYTARPIHGEQTLGQSKLKRGDLRDWSKKNGNVTLTLFDQPPDTELPIYGRQSTIQGAIMLENTQDIASVNIKIHGYVKCKSLPEYGGSYDVLLEMPFTLWDKTRQEPCASVLPIDVTLPANYTLNGKTGPLPPTFLYSFYDVQGGTPGQKTRIRYEIIVDVERNQSSLKDKIGHTLSTDFIYLPRSRPAKQPSTVPSTVFEVEMEHRHGGKAKEEDPIIWKLCLPPPGTYPLSRPIPFRVAVTSRSAALLTPFAPSKRDKSAIRVYLLRHVSFTTDANIPLWRTFSIGEGVLTAAPPSDNLWLKNTVRRPGGGGGGGGETASLGSNSDKEGWASYDWIGTVKANKDVICGGFSVANVAVQDYMVLSVVPPNPRGGTLLEAKKSVSIQLTTDEYDSPIIPSEFYGDRKEPPENDSDDGHSGTNGTNGASNGTNGHVGVYVRSCKEIAESKSERGYAKITPAERWQAHNTLSKPRLPMPPFSVSQLKGSASNLKNSTTQRFQDTKSKFSSKSSATSTYDPRFPGTKAPPPPPPPIRRVGQGAVEEDETEEYHDDADDDVGPPPPRPLPSGPPPVIPRNTKPVQSGSDTSRSGSNPLLKLNGTQLPSSLNQIKWSQVSQNDKEQLFGWLDEFFGIKQPSSSSSKLEDTRQPGKPSVLGRPQNHAPADSFKTSHPAETTYGSSGHDFCMYFSSSTRWDSAWYATPAAVPPPLMQVRDCIRSHYTKWRGDMHTLGGGVLYSDMSACWYTVEWSKRNAQDTSQARRKATVLPRPEAMSLDELVAAHETYGETIAAFAEGYEGTGQWCARGECWDLASEALKSFEQWDYIPKPIPSIGKTHGHLIYEGKAWGKGQAAGRWRGGDDRIRRGDIVQWLTTTIVDGYTTSTLGAPDHTAVIVKDQIPRITPFDGASMKPGDLVQLEVVEQSVHSAPDRKVYRLEGMTAGEVWIYRPVSMEAYLKLLFTPNWPEGMEALVEA